MQTFVNTSATASEDWIRYFNQNALEPDLPWNDATSLSGAERWAVIRSIQQFELGEGASGTRLIRFAHRFCDRSGNDAFLVALKLFLKEEQRHSLLLRRFLDHECVPCLQRHWVHRIFRRLRGLAGLELCLKVLVTAETLAMPYYAALRDATQSPLLKSVCRRILEDESAHLRFQAFAIGQLQQSRPAALNSLLKMFHAAFLFGTAAVVWIGHRRVFQSAGRPLRRVLAEAIREFDLLYRPV